MRLNSTKKKVGITLIEVIIAIIVFGTWVLVLLSMLTQNITWIYDITYKTTAVTLAKEGLDMVYHLRDSNLERGTFRNCSEIDPNATLQCAWYFYDGGGQTTYMIDRRTDDLYFLTGKNVATGSTWLYYHTGVVISTWSTTITGFRYNHDSSGGTQTLFKRYILFKPVSTYSVHTGMILQVESHVHYTRSGRDRKVVLESLIGDIR